MRLVFLSFSKMLGIFILASNRSEKGSCLGFVWFHEKKVAVRAADIMDGNNLWWWLGLKADGEPVYIWVDGEIQWACLTQWVCSNEWLCPTLWVKWSTHLHKAQS